MTNYGKYSSYLDGLISMSAWGRGSITGPDFLQTLNGGAAEALHESVSPEILKQFGAFFTSELIGRNAVGPAAREAKSKLVLDPACGAGDLLLRWAEHLPVFTSLEKTLDHWGTLLEGLDLHKEFIAVTKRRLVILAIHRGAQLKGSQIPHIDQLFPGIKEGDFLTSTDSIRGSVLLNPPFNSIIWPDHRWTSGKTSQAAIFFLKCLNSIRIGQKIVAILPDVLRCGTRYEKWRTEVGSRLRFTRLEPIGRFGKLADVDVFIIEGVASGVGGHISWQQNMPASRTLEDISTVKVGSVVPHRDPMTGPLTRYYLRGGWFPGRQHREER